MRSLLIALASTLFILPGARGMAQDAAATPLAPTASSSPTALTAPEAYRLQTGDSFGIVYRLNPEYDETVNVQPDGTVSVDLLGSLAVRGLTVAQARLLLEQAASKRLRDPELFLELKEWERPHYTVLGEVGAPGRFELRGPLTVEDGLAIAGGLKISARHTKILLIHRVNDTVGETELVDVRRLEHPTKPGTELLALRPGDIVVVPISKLAKVERYVKIVNFGIGSYIPL